MNFEFKVTEEPRLVRRGNDIGINFYSSYRPLRFSELYGHAKTVGDGIKKQLLLNNGILSHAAIAFTGSNSTGKTTLALILALALNCKDLQKDKDGNKIEPCLECLRCKGILNRSLDGRDPSYIVKNAAKLKNDDIISIVENEIYGGNVLMSSRYGTRVICLEEAHNLTKKSIENLLLPVENVLQNNRRARVHLLLTSSDYDTLFANKAWKSRILAFRFKEWSNQDIYNILVDINKQEYKLANRPKVSTSVLSRIIDESDSSVRSAINLLQAVLEQSSVDKNGYITLDTASAVLNIYQEEEHLFENFIDKLINNKKQECYKILRDHYYDRKSISNEDLTKRIISALTAKGLYNMEKNITYGEKLLKMAITFSTHMKDSDYQDRYSSLVLATAAVFRSDNNL